MSVPTLAHTRRLASEHYFAAALLRSDANGARAILAQRSPNWSDAFCFDTAVGKLPVLIYERVCQLELAKELEALTGADGRSTLEKLRQRATSAMIDYRSLDHKFMQLLDLLTEFTPSLVWLKGTTLSRTLYAREQRFSVDLDVVVDRRVGAQVIAKLKTFGFAPYCNESGHCHQFGVGPIKSLSDLFLVPADDCGGCHNLTLKKPGWPALELKFNGLETGLVMVEHQRFFEEAIEVRWAGRTFLGPSHIDHLMIELVHFHKHNFSGWGWMMDIHVLARALSEAGEWTEFVRRCHKEGIAASAWKGLSMAQELLSTAVPGMVLDALKPAHAVVWQRFLPKVSSEFIWNCNSLPMLTLNSLLVGGRRRKWRVLKQSFSPSDEFLSRYYANERPLTPARKCFFLIVHWLVLVMPGGLIRRTIGRLLWPTSGDAQFIY